MQEHISDAMVNNEEALKETINREYGVYFKKEGTDPRGRKMDLYGDEKSWNPLPRESVYRGNPINKHFKVIFGRD